MSPGQDTSQRLTTGAPGARLRGGAILLLLTALSACGGAGNGGDAQHELKAGPEQAAYRGQITLRPKQHGLDAEWSIRYVPDSTTADSVSFLLNEKLEVSELSGPSVAGYTRHEGVSRSDRITVRFREDVRPGSAVDLHFSYGGQPRFPSRRHNRISREWVELSVESFWHPLFASFDQELVGVLEVRLPPGWTAVASGSTARRDSALVIRNTVPQIDAAFLAAPTLQTTSSGDYSVYHTGADPERLDRILDAAAACGRYLNRRFANGDSLPPVQVVVAPRSDGPAYARKNYVVVPDRARDSRLATVEFLCHELAHFWSHGANPMSADNWMNEGFAVYTAARFIRREFGTSVYDSIVGVWVDQARGQPPVWTPDGTGRPPGKINYYKAPLVLRRLEQAIGTAPFDHFTRAYMIRKPETTTELLGILEEVAGDPAKDTLEALLSR